MGQLFNIPDHDYEERSFEQIMADLSVPIDKVTKSAKAVTPWITPAVVRIGKKEISVNKTYIGFAPDVVADVGGKIAFMIVDYDGQKAFAYKPDPDGYDIRKTKNGQHRIVLSNRLRDIIDNSGIKAGRK